MTSGHIEVRGARVHNLKDIDLDIPRHELIVICGVSGSGKTSLALDTLYAEGQRRYIETFSLQARQFLERLDKPEADRIDGIPPAIAVKQHTASRSNRVTIGATTEAIDYLRLLYAKIADLICPTCGLRIEKHSPQSAAEQIAALPLGTRVMICFEPQQGASNPLTQFQSSGFVRVIADGQVLNIADAANGSFIDLHVVVDRLIIGQQDLIRLRDSIETAFRHGEGRAIAFADVSVAAGAPGSAVQTSIDGKNWPRLEFSTRLECPNCHRLFADPDPRRFSFNSPLGACPTCEGFGTISDIDLKKIVPDTTKTIRSGAIAPWNTPKHRHELDELLALADDYLIPVDVPFNELTEEQLRLIREGVPERKFGGLTGFFRWLDRHKYKLHYRVFANRWRSSRTCPTCHGTRLNEEALAWKIAGLSIAALTGLTIDRTLAVFNSLDLSVQRRSIAQNIFDQLNQRLHFLIEVGLGYLSLDRPLRTLSSGEAHRVMLTSVLGSSLVNMLYILDEPSAGLHSKDVSRLVQSIRRLSSRRNTVIAVEHEEDLIRAADRLIEFGPAAGDSGGQITFQGPLDQMLKPSASLTGEFLAGRRGISIPEKRRPTNHGWIKLMGARGHNLKNVTVEFPLNTLCVVSGVSGAGKSSLVQETLYGAICSRKSRDCEPPPLPFDEIVGCGQIDDCILVDQTPIGRSSRVNPATYIKAFDPIRQVFADTVEARTHNYTAGHFSFNVEAGRCSACQGEGFLTIDMQFMADVQKKCGQCGGARYRKEVLAIKYRGKSIADVLAMTGREAFSFFRGQPKVQARLKQLIDVGLDYLQLGQSASTLSSGEAQRLKLAAHLSAATKSRTLFLLDEPTTGLHFADVVTLLDCFEALLSVGHSLIIVEHNLQLMRSADYIIDLGPEAGDDGGQVVACGIPEELARSTASHTGRYLSQSLINAFAAS
ncbi:MAG TPA: excinuclease ABC subunit UvrA [Pirellulaceae bacterium]